jgi:hypothetical protein
MGVFLRWGAFGIVAVAALMYAYNASKRMSELQQLQTPVVTSTDEDGQESVESQHEQPGAEVLPPATPQCEEELQVAERALAARRENEPLDRLLRIQSIAFQPDPKRRVRLENVARKWFARMGADPDAAELRYSVLRDCWRFSPAP